MAIPKDIWDKAKFLFELGKSLSDINRETNIESSSISKKAKKEGWVKAKNQELKSDIIDLEADNSRLLKNKSTAIEKLAQLNDFEITLFDETVRKELKHESLVFSTASLALIRNNQILTENKKTVMLKVAQFGADGQRIGEDYEPFTVPLSPSDVKDCIDGTDKASITLKVNERFAPKIELNNTNAQQNNNMTREETMQAVSDALPN